MEHYKCIIITQILTVSLLLIGCQQKGQNQTVSSIPFTNIDVATARSMLASDDKTIFMDVRTPEETAEGKIPGCIELDFRESDFATKLDQLNKDDAYVVYCRSGRRSAEAAQLMSEKGFKNVQNMEGGYLAWTE